MSHIQSRISFDVLDLNSEKYDIAILNTHNGNDTVMSFTVKRKVIENETLRSQHARRQDHRY